MTKLENDDEEDYVINNRNTPSIIIDIGNLKDRYSDDPIIQHLKKRIQQCEKRRIAYWDYYVKLRIMNNVLSIPLLLITSATGITTIAQVGYNTKIILPVISTIFGVSSAVLSALQRYFAYPERAEHSKYMAKNYARIQRKIEDVIVYIESSSASYDSKSFKKTIDDITKEFEKIAYETEDIPPCLMEKFENIILSPQTSQIPQASQIPHVTPLKTSRGSKLSSYAPKPKNYSPPSESRSPRKKK